ncbi:MAG TPA: acyl-CoA dehydrogenase family protein, partial [Xanthomonadales bacterium]|nr:acyl-CoA dehydrogenase family protein [Xanthomonadales bacterium]
ELQERYLHPMASGEEIWCQLFTEPGAGSDLAGIVTRAERDGDDWIVNGQKIWTSFAHLADFAILLARTDPEVPKHQGLTYFVLDMKAPGVEVRPIRLVSGESGLNEVFLTNVRVPDSHRVGPEGQGWKVALTTLMNERLAVGTGYPTHFEDVMELACNLHDEDGPLIERGDIRDRLADWFVRANALKYTGFRLFSSLSRGESPGPEASLGKLVLGRGRQEMGWLALEMLDASGVILDSENAPLAAALQEAYFASIGDRIAGGTEEIMLNIIGERVLGLPPEIRVDKDVPFNQRHEHRSPES